MAEIRIMVNQNYMSVIFDGNCPHCDLKIAPIGLTSVMENNNSRNLIWAIMKCPSCGTNFFALFMYSSEDKKYHSLISYPIPKPKVDIPIEIKNCFPDFYEIYIQAAEAEIAGLDKICGMAYRKSLEFLIKSYAIELDPSSKDNIEKELLVPTINRINNTKISALATAAAWLGNDHSHFIAKHPDYDLEQLKAFIKVACQEILNQKTFDEAMVLLSKKS